MILRELFAAGMNVLDLRLVCTAPSDYSDASPIEPSEIGGAKIARQLHAMLNEINFGDPTTHVFPRKMC